MQNVVLNTINKFPHNTQPIICSFEQATNTIVVVNQEKELLTFSYDERLNKIEEKTYNPIPIEELSDDGQILLAELLVDKSEVLIVTTTGRILTVNPEDSSSDLKAENEDGIAAASLSPTQEYLYVVTKNGTLIQLELEQFDLVNEVPVLDEENPDYKGKKLGTGKPEFCWRPDGNFFGLSVEVEGEGRRCQTREKMLNIYTTPSKSDTDPKGLVQSVSDKSWPHMGSAIAWQPNGIIMAGWDRINDQSRVIFWEKNGLRHLEFTLPSECKSINHLSYSPDSAILYVDSQTTLEYSPRVLYMFYRSNYKWHLKYQIELQPHTLYITFKTKNNKIILVNQSEFTLIDYSIQIAQSEWVSKDNEDQKVASSIIFCIDGSTLKVSDFAKSLIPPPMCLYSIDLKTCILGAAIKKGQIFAITRDKYFLILRDKISKQWSHDLSEKLFSGVRLLSQQSSSLKFIANGYHFAENQHGEVKMLDPVSDGREMFERTYHLEIENSSTEQMAEVQKVDIKCHFEEDTLTINDTVLSEDCLSVLFYHEFILYTVSTHSMYDKMYIFNLKLDRWVWDDSSESVPLAERLEQLEQKQKLHVRNVERGSKIITCSRGRVVFQLPRGNLQGIYPKVIIINQVKNKMQDKLFGEAFELIRTHKLDFNLLVDLAPQRFIENANQILSSIKRVDYLNLLISQLNEKISSEVQYALFPEEAEAVQNYYDLHLKGKKIEKLCAIISKELRDIHQSKYILSIFTSEIRRNHLNEVLFEIKDLKKNDVEIVVPPHLSTSKTKPGDGKKSKPALTSQQILEYICWLVDANYIYNAALLTYDLELASMTARCTQKDPKEFIPYIESLKAIKDEVEFKKTICTDLKKFDIAIHQLSKGSEEQKDEAIELIRKHKLYKCGLKTFAKEPKRLFEVRMIMADELLSMNEISEAFQICKSAQNYQKCLEIAKRNMDSEKIKESLEGLGMSHQQQKKAIEQILENLKDEAKNKSDLASLYLLIGNFEQGVRLFLKASNYRSFYQYLNKVSEDFISKEVTPELALQSSLRKNLLFKDKNQYIEKQIRLTKVHKRKKYQGGETHTFKNRQNEDMYSEVSVSSKASSYTMSTTTGMRKKKDKKRHILTRNVKEGSILEEEYILAFLEDIRSRAEENIRDTKLLVQHLIYVNMIDEADELKDVAKEYIAVVNGEKAKSFAKCKFEELHPEAAELYAEEKKNPLTFDSFNYLL